MAEQVQEREEFVEEAGEHTGEQGAAKTVGEDVVIEEETTQGTKGPQRCEKLITCFKGR